MISVSSEHIFKYPENQTNRNPEKVPMTLANPPRMSRDPNREILQGPKAHQHPECLALNVSTVQPETKDVGRLHYKIQGIQ